MEDKREVKLCKDCRHYLIGQCWHPPLLYDVVVGGRIGRNPYLERSDSISRADLCGPEGKLWEAKT